MDSKKRTLTKAIVWNVIGLLTMSVVGYLTTGSVSTGGKMAVINTVLGLSMYVGYERFWARIGWGMS